jgi:hypothetical protein
MTLPGIMHFPVASISTSTLIAGYCFSKTEVETVMGNNSNNINKTNNHYLAQTIEDKKDNDI